VTNKLKNTLNFSVELTNPEKINPLITRYKCYICSPNEPANNFIFSKDVLTKMANTVLGTAVVGGFMNNEDPSLLGGHDGSVAPIGGGLTRKTPRPEGIGFADPYIPCWFETYKNKEFLTCYTYLWTGRFPELDNLNERDIHQSMEVTAEYTQEGQYKVVSDALVLGLCMLENVEPAFQDSTFIQFSKLNNNVVQKDIESMKKEFNEIHSQFEKKDDITNFPKNGDNEEISLENSQYKLFDLKYAEDLKNNYPTIWKLGGNIQGNSQFKKLSTILNRKDSKNLTDDDKKAIKEREVWSARHYDDYLINGVIAQIKWLLIGSKGEKYMKDLIDEKKAKINNKKSAIDNSKKEGKIVNENDFVKDEIGSGDYSITVNKSKEAMSTNAWGDVDKTTEMHKVVQAKNVKTIVDDIYALVEADWQNAPSQHLKYPIMEVKSNNEAVYNREALKSALGYAKAQNETSVVNKITKIYSDFGLNKDNFQDFEFLKEEYTSLFEDKKDDKPKKEEVQKMKKDKKLMAKMNEACSSQTYKKEDKEMCKYSDVIAYDDNYMYAIDIENCKLSAIPYSKDKDTVKPDFDNCKMAKLDCSVFDTDNEDDDDSDVMMALKKAFTVDENTEAPANEKRSEEESEVDKEKVDSEKKEQEQDKEKDVEVKEEKDKKEKADEKMAKDFEEMKEKYSKLEEKFAVMEAEKKALEDKHNKFEMDSTLETVKGQLSDADIESFKNKVSEFAKIEDWSNAVLAFAYKNSLKNFDRVPLPQDTEHEKKSVWDRIEE
jgi:hypothetical protein